MDDVHVAITDQTIDHLDVREFDLHGPITRRFDQEASVGLVQAHERLEDRVELLAVVGDVTDVVERVWALGDVCVDDIELRLWKLAREHVATEFARDGDTIEVFAYQAIVFVHGVGLAHGHARDLFTFRLDAGDVCQRRLDGEKSLRLVQEILYP